MPIALETLLAVQPPKHPPQDAESLRILEILSQPLGEWPDHPGYDYIPIVRNWIALCGGRRP